ncbi:hypothetical protein SBRCBS47491_001891 [Sporothrix bragantina]|uniref:Ankyrin repeat protein n=1 Tax=Sporothrix bragantina TaxID=671064 RepID=A0ABP0B2E8_9PEZI
MFRWVKTHLGTTAASSSSPSSSTPPAKTYRHIPGLYPVGNTTVETYFRRLLEGPLTIVSDDDLPKLVRRDIVAAAVVVARQAGLTPLPSADQLLPLLTRCITGTYEAVAFADEYFVEEGVPSSLEAPLVLQILVAVALKHRHADMLKELLAHHGQHRPQETLFEDPDNFREAPHGILSDPNYGPRVWKMLADAGWAQSLETDEPVSDTLAPIDSEEARPLVMAAAAQSKTDLAGALAVLDELVRRGLDPVPYTGTLLDVLVKGGTAEMVAHFLPLVSRKMYDGVPPRAKWPGMQSVVTMAAARVDSSRCGDERREQSERSEETSTNERSKTLERSEDEKETEHSEDPESTRVLRVLVDLAGMDVHVEAGVWYKAGPDDEHPEALKRSKRLVDGSCADDPPLLAAVQAGNMSSVRFLLERGVADRKKGVLGEAVARARERQNEAMIALLEGWTEEAM